MSHIFKYFFLIIFITFSELKINAQLSVEAGSNATICIGQFFTSNISVTGGITPYSFHWSNNATSINITTNPTITTTYYVSVTDNISATDVDSITVIVNTIPIVNAGNSFQPICSGNSIILGGIPTAYGGSGSYAYTWSSVPSGFSSNLPNPVVSPTITTNYFVTVTSGVCTTIATTTVNVQPKPNVSFNFSPNNVCSGTPISFTSTVSGGTTPYYYLWNFGDNSSSNQANPTHIFNSFGCNSVNFQVALILFDVNGCSDTASNFVIVKQRPNPELSDQDIFSPFNNCENGPSSADPDYTIILNNSTQNTSCISGLYTIDWGDGSSLQYSSLSSFPISYTYNELGAFNLVMSATGTNGCLGTSTYIVANQSNPAVGISSFGSTQGCLPQTYSFILAQYQNNSPGTYYVWDFGDGSPDSIWTDSILAITDSISHTYTTTSCGLPGNTFVVTVLAINQCDTTPTTISGIKVWSDPEADFSVSDTIGCVNTCFAFTNTTISGFFGSNCTTATNNIWDFGDGTTSTAINPPCHYFPSIGIYTVSLNADNPCPGNGTIHTQNIYVIDPPTAQATPNVTNGCAPLITSFTNTSIGDFISSSWSVLPLTGWSFINGTTVTSDEPQIQFNIAGTYTVTLEVSNNCGTDLISFVIQVSDKPIISIAPISNACGSLVYTANATYNSNGSTITNYNWLVSSSSTNWNFVSPTNANSQNPVISFNEPGIFTLTITATNACGTSTVYRTVTIIDLPIVTNNPLSQTICSGFASSLVSLTSNISGTTFNWSASSSIVTGYQTNGTSTIPPQILTNNSNALGSVAYSITPTANGCTGNSSVYTINVNPLPELTNSPLSQQICTGNSTVAVNLTSDVLGTNINWIATADQGITSFITTGTNQISAQTLNNLSPNVQNVYITISLSANNCNGIPVNYLISVNPLPAINAGNDTTFCNQAFPATLLGYPSGGTWSGSALVSSSGVFTPNGNGNYILTYSYTDINNCVNSDNLTVTVANPSVANAGNDTSVCLSSNPVQLTGFPSGGNWSGSSFVSSNGIFNPANSGVYNIFYNYGLGTCLVSDNLTITVNSLPTITSNADTSVCIGSNSFNLTGTPSGGSWSGNGITNSVTGNFNPFATGNYTVTYSYTDLIGCTNTENVNVTVNSLPNVSAGNDTVLCNQAIATSLSGFPIGGTWSGSSLVTSGGIFTPNGTGTFTLTYSYTDNNYCSSSDNVNVTVIDQSTAFAGNDTLICVNSSSFQCLASPTGGTWSGTSLVSPQGDFNPSASGVYTLTYSIGSGSCLTTDNKNITVNSLPVVDAGLNQQVCIDFASFNLSGTPIGGLWSGNGITNNITGAFNPQIAGVGNQTITYSYTDIYSCSNSDTKSITVNQLPTVFAGIDTIICNQSIPVTFTGSPLNGTWSGSSLLTALGVFTPNGIGNYVLIYSYTDINNCSNSDSLTVTVVNATIPSAGNDTSLCQNSGQIQLSASPSGGTWSGSILVSLQGNFNPTTDGVYTLVYSYGSGSCLATDTKVITVNLLPSVSAGISQSLCINSNPIDLVESPAGGTWTGNGITNNATGTFDPQVSGVGNFIITYSFTNSSTLCSNNDTALITVNQLPTAAFTISSLLCENNPILFTNNSTGATTYSWQFGDNISSSLTSPTHTYADTGSYTVVLTSYSQYNCSKTYSETLQILQVPEVDFSFTPDSGCSPLMVTFINSSTGYNPTYFWDFGNASTSNLENPNPETYYAGMTDTTYIVTLSASNGCGTANKTDTIVVQSYPYVDFGILVNWACTPALISFIDSVQGSPQYMTWDFGDGSAPLIINQLGTIVQHTFFTDSVISIYNVTLTAQNQCGINSETHDVYIYPVNVTAFASADLTIGCPPLTVSFENFSVGNIISIWDFDDGTVITTDNSPQQNTFYFPGNYNVELIVHDTCSYDTIYIPITVLPLPDLSFTFGNDSVCAGEEIILYDTSTPLSNVIWLMGNGDTIYNNQVEVHYVYPESGTYNVSLIAAEPVYGCNDTITQSFTVSLTPVASFTPSQIDGCLPFDVQFSNNSTDADYFIWDFGDGSDYSIDDEPNHIYTEVGTYQITLTAINANECYDSYFQNIIIHPEPISNFSISPDTFSCTFPVTVQLNNLSSGAYNYFWDFGNGDTSITSLNQIVTYSAIGDYLITLITENQFHCFDTIQNFYHIYQEPIADIYVSPQIGCEPFGPVFSDSSQFGTTFYWNFGDGETLITDNQNQFNHIYQNEGIYSIQYIVTGIGGCNDVIDLDDYITIYSVPVLSISPDSTVICRGDSILVTVSGSINYQWSPSNLFSSANPENSAIYAKPTETTTFIVSGTTVDGCTSTIDMIILVEPNPEYPFETDTCLHENESVILNAKNNGLSFLWSNGSDNQSVKVIMDVAITYNLWVMIIPKVCPTIIDSIIVDVCPMVDIPNAFSPNGDDVNDVFRILGHGIEEMNLKMYNRWGQVVYTSTNFKDFWDGTFNGQPQNSDVYFYVLTGKYIDGKVFKREGNVTLIR